MQKEENIKIIKLDGGESSDDSDMEPLSDAKKVTELAKDSESEFEDSETEETSEEVEESEVNESSEEDNESDCSTTELLAADPLYFVLSRFFISEDGKNIATILQDIDSKLGELVKNKK